MNVERPRILSETGVKIILTVVILVWGVKGIIPMSSMYILPDEFGYLSAGAWFRGYDWSSIMSHSLYYSYGYGFLVALVMAIARSSEWIYKGILFINLGLLCLNFWMSDSIGKKLFPRVEWKVRVLVVFALNFYVSNIVYFKIAWPEILLMTCYMIIVLLILHLKESPGPITCVVLGIMSVLMYVVHQRTLGIVIAVICVVCFMVIFKKLTLIQGLCFVCSFSLAFLLHSWMKVVVQEGLYQYSSVTDSTIIGVNDFAGQKDKLIQIFTSFSGLRLAVISFLGKLFYLVASSFGLFACGLWACGRKLIVGWKKKHLQDESDTLFFVLSAVGCIGISAIFMLNGSRQDSLIYGRYSETVLQVIMLIGFFEIWQNKNKLRDIVLIAGVLITAVIVNYKLQNLDSVHFNTVSALGTSLFFQDGQMVGMAVWKSTLLCVIIGIILRIMNRRNTFIGILCSSGLLIAVWGGTAWQYTKGVYGAQVANQEFQKLSDLIEQYGEGQAVAYVEGDTDPVSRIQISQLQFDVPEREFQYVGLEDDIASCNTSMAVVLKSPRLTDVLANGYRIVREYRGLVLIVKCGSKAEQQMMEDGLLLLSDAKDGAIIFYGAETSATQNGISNGRGIVSDGTEGYLMFGPYLPMSAGKYEITVSIKLLEAGRHGIGEYDIVDGTKVFQKEPLDEALIPMGEDVILSINAELKENLDMMEFRVFVTEGTILEIKQVAIKPGERTKEIEK